MSGLTPIEREAMDLFVRMMDRWGRRITRALQRRHRGDDAALIRAYQAALGIADQQAVRAHYDRDQVTILECVECVELNRQATKTITPASILEYDAGTWFTTTEVEVAGIGGLVDVLARIERQPRRLVIRGRLIAGRGDGYVRRLVHPDPKTNEQPYFEPCPRRWCALDFDSFELPEGVAPVDLAAVAAVAVARLPEPLWIARIAGLLPPAAEGS